MLKLLIADDDEWVREGICRNVNWKDSGIEVVGTARDGQEGWELVESLKPDLLLTDIRMPFMDGLELAKRVYEHAPDVKVVFLTGYDDFTYAKQAIQLKAANYIMKYEDNDVILQAVTAAGLELLQERANREISSRGRVPARNKFFSDLLSVGGTEEWMRRESQWLELPFSGNRYAVAVIHAEDGRRFTRPNAMLNPELLLFAVQNICEELFAGEPAGSLYFVSYNQRINAVFSFPDEWPEADAAARIGQIAERVRDTVSQVLKVTVRIGVGSVKTSIGQLPDSYNEALSAVQLGEVSETSGITFSQDIRHSQSSHHSMMNRIVEVIRERYGDAGLTLTSLASEVHLTPAYVSTLFKKHQQINFVEYLIRVRMEKAAELLVHSDLKAYEIAEKVGYPNSHYFSVAFKKHFGLTPLEYRQKHQQ